MDDYPKNLFEFEELFSSNNACLEYLARLRWPTGFSCPKYGEQKMWQMKNGRLLCSGCRYQQYILQRTIFQDSHVELKMWYICSQKNGVSALGLQRVLDFGSYRTARLMLHKLRRAMIRPKRKKLSGKIEVDETYIGGFREETRGRGAAGKHIIPVAAGCKGKGTGRIRLLCVWIRLMSGVCQMPYRK